MKKAVKIILIVIISIIIVVAVASAIMIGITKKQMKDLMYRKEIPANPKIGQWYRITPDGARSSDGSQWHGLIKLGDEDKVAVYFYGGGVSVDEHSAAWPQGTGDGRGFYTPNVTNDGLEIMGFGNPSEENPFRDWTMLVLPYSTADFHCGTGDYPYTSKDGTQKVLYHHGYTNMALFMEKAMQYVDEPDTVLITGFSAGSFGTSLLANDILTDYFPNAQNTTIFADSSLLLNDHWKEIAQNVWQAPASIVSRLHSNNLVLDSLQALSKDHPNTKILFSCSVRDSALTAVQNYFDMGDDIATEESGVKFQSSLKEMVSAIKELPNSGVLIWDAYRDTTIPSLTGHTIMMLPTFFDEGIVPGITAADWVMDGVNGNIQDYGLELLDQP
ncbi:MAG: pectin acetylesterase-family hydrolase [Eubacteriales bacterium]|nr:pectin acetylesterase-family hydrolase [Eubacteriales bacterium]